MKGLHQCSARMRHQKMPCAASKYFRCSSSWSSTLSSTPPLGTASTGRKTPQTKAVGRPSTSTARLARRPYFSHTPAICADTASEAGAPRLSASRSRA